MGTFRGCCRGTRSSDGIGKPGKNKEGRMDEKNMETLTADAVVAELDKALADLEARTVEKFRALGYWAKVKVRRGAVRYGAKVVSVKAPAKVTA